MKKLLVIMVILTMLIWTPVIACANNWTEPGYYYNDSSHQVGYWPTNPQGGLNSHYHFLGTTLGGGEGGTGGSALATLSIAGSNGLPPERYVVGTAPNQASPAELNFISPNERDVQALLPKFGCDVVKPLSVDDCIIEVIWQSNEIKFKNLYRKILKGLKSDEVKKLDAKSVRYQVREIASSKTWTTGGSLAGNGVGALSTTVTGATGGIFPQVGRSKSSNLYTIFLVRVQVFK